VLPGTGGLTRLTDKRKVRHDLADVFCTVTEGVRGQRAKDWKLVDAIAKTGEFASAVSRRALELAGASDRPRNAHGIALTPLAREDRDNRYGYGYVEVTIDRAARTATFTVHAPKTAQAADIASIEAAGAAWWPLQMARELDDAILTMRTNELAIGTWLFKTSGDIDAVLACDARSRRTRTTGSCARRQDAPAHARAPRRLVAHDVRADRAVLVLRRNAARARARLRSRVHAAIARRPGREPRIAVSSQNFGPYPMVNARRASRGVSATTRSDRCHRAPHRRRADRGRRDESRPRHERPDDLDWDDEIRIAIEERASMSPDALTGMEANLALRRQGDDGHAHLRTPVGVAELDLQPAQRGGEKGALKMYGRAAKRNSISTADLTMSTIDTTSRSQQRRPRRRPRAQPRARALAAQLRRVVERDGPEGTQGSTSYLRTAVSVEPSGWAHFDYVKMPDTAGASSSPAGCRSQDPLRRAHRRRGMAGRAGRAPRETFAASSSRKATPSPRPSSSKRISA
jgi:benzoyl-CoA-dihydrodiol lyase